MPAIDRKRPLIDIRGKKGGGVMYFDAPGIYLTHAGDQMSDTQAREVGFDVDKWKKQKLVKGKRDEAIVELQNFEADLEKKTLAEIEAELGGDAQRIDRSAYPGLEPMGFDSEGNLRETKSLKVVPNGDVFDVFHKTSNDSIVLGASGADAVRAILNWHEDNPNDAEEAKKEESVETLFSDS